MSTKTVALDSRIYRRLSMFRKESESFSKAIARMLDEIENAHTGSDVLARLDGVEALSEREAASMTRVVQDARESEQWERHDLR